MADFLPGETGGIPDFLRRRGLFGPLLRTDMPVADEEPGDSPVLRQRPPGPSLLREDEVTGGEREMPTPGERHLADLGGQARALEPQPPAPMSGKRRLLQAVLTMAPTALGGIFGGLEGASGAASGTVEAAGERQAVQEREGVRRNQERMRLIEMMEQERRQQETQQFGQEQQERQFGQQTALERMRQAGALERVQAKPERPEPAVEDDRRYRDIVSRQGRKQSVSLDDAAWAKAYEKSKTLGPALTAGAAATRQERSFDQQQKMFNMRQAALTSATKTMIEAAPTVQQISARIAPRIDALESELGPGAGRWAEFMAGKVGANNPEYVKLRTDVGLLRTLLMRMHVGARGGQQMLTYFRDLIDQGKQSPDNLRAALAEIDAYASDLLEKGRAGGMSPNVLGGGREAQQQQIPEGARGATRDGKPVIRQGGRWVLAQ